MLRKFKIKPDTIVKVKYFDNSTVIYSKDEFWVCKPTQTLDVDKDGFITIELKDKCEEYGKR